MFTIALLSQKGGTGKTTIACALAVEAEEANEPAVLIDLDPQGSASAWGDLRTKEGPLVTPTPASRLERVIDAARSSGAARVVIDTPPQTGDAALSAGRMADLIIVPCHPATADLHAIGTTIDIATIAHKPVIVVINGALVKHPSNDEAREAIRTYHVQACPVILHQRIDHQHAFTAGLSATELAPQGKAAGEVRELEKWIRSVQE